MQYEVLAAKSGDGLAQDQLQVGERRPVLRCHAVGVLLVEDGAQLVQVGELLRQFVHKH